MLGQGLQQQQQQQLAAGGVSKLEDGRPSQLGGVLGGDLALQGHAGSGLAGSAAAAVPPIGNPTHPTMGLEELGKAGMGHGAAAVAAEEMPQPFEEDEAMFWSPGSVLLDDVHSFDD